MSDTYNITQNYQISIEKLKAQSLKNAREFISKPNNIDRSTKKEFLECLPEEFEVKSKPLPPPKPIQQQQQQQQQQEKQQQTITKPQEERKRSFIFVLYNYYYTNRMIVIVKKMNYQNLF